MAIKKCFIVCWFGELPGNIDIWLKTCEHNRGFDFLFFTDAKIDRFFPSNVKVIPFSIGQFKKRAQGLTSKKVSVDRSYRVCEFRPAFGEIFKEELKGYDFWGHCDVDVVFGNLNDFITDALLEEYDAVLNGGHLSLYRNAEKINRLYLGKGGAFDFDTVASHDAAFSFDEITGIRRIAEFNHVRIKSLIPYIETEIKYRQLRSRLDRINPDDQAYYWEKGDLYRVKAENGQVLYQKQAYIHLQKRKVTIDARAGVIGDAFWITPTGFENKPYPGEPQIVDIKRTNPYEGEQALKQQGRNYKIKRFLTILRRPPYQIYVRLVQEKYGISHDHGSLEERPWEKY